MENTIQNILFKYWGYDSFRPFQEETISSILDSKDTLTVLPTGGGKSICFQVPALICEGMAVIVSPLISLMKDQVDYLKDIGIAAECLNSSLNSSDRAQVTRRIKSGNLKLLYLAPERLSLESMREFLKEVKLSFFVIDEAHCISHWGHDFRAEYRQMGIIKDEFKGVCVHAFTATATCQVQEDIVKQLKLESPHFYIGSVDRPNLTYRMLRRSGNLIPHIVDVIKKRPDEAGIVYCLRRVDVDRISEKLNSLGYQNLPYHAGMPNEVRKRNQDAFSAEKTSLIVATIAFGMGIDRSNIRYIIHAAMPKSIEHYQQETGRAGRDGLPADCYMFYSGSDYRTWEYLLGYSTHGKVMRDKLNAMYNFCGRPGCRHRYLVNYFNQAYQNEDCRACDYCLREFDMIEEPLIAAQQILSCVKEVRQRFGVNHVTDILKGNLTENIERWGHEQLSAFSLMRDQTKVFIRNIVEQLLEQGFLDRESEFKTLFITDLGQEVFSGDMVPKLAKPITIQKKKEVEKKRKVRRDVDWEGIDEELFQILRAKRRQLTEEKNVPAYIIFGDKTLKDMARVKPVSEEEFSTVFGVGEAKLAQYGEIFTKVIREYLKSEPVGESTVELKSW
ncbi:MAG TPA: DNA helicase RecQ [Candidatus Omnitrophica bacterium]|nr:DNA helicase RecQ [Candidatus Omnitrophota bacterium]